MASTLAWNRKIPLKSESLKIESEKLAGSWMRHDTAWLRDYLVGGVEDPRLNIQSLLARHFIVHSLFASHLDALMEQEIRVAAVMNWLTALASQAGDLDLLQSVLYALQRQSDNAEGIPIPSFVAQTFAFLPSKIGDKPVANYIEQFLTGTRFEHGRALFHQPSLDTFQNLWASILSLQPTTVLPSIIPERLSLIEPACGSANDYRFLYTYGIARFIDYTGFDLCAKNIQNATTLFPDVHFKLGDVFEIQAPDQSFDLCLVHDLFEHLSLEGLLTAVQEVCRVTRHALCVGFFQMDEIDEHLVRPNDNYHWNLLSMARIKQLFASNGFAAQVVHIGTFLRQAIGCDQTHNPNAYSFLLRRLPGLPQAG